MAAAGDAVVDLPPEILIEILNRLPAKSILRFKSVCKLWYSLVSRPDFISDYSVRNQNKNGDRVLLALCKEGVPIYSYISHNESFTESNEHNYIPERFVYGGEDHVQIIGSCNGLICLSTCYSRWTHEEGVYINVRTFLIWNPSIRKTVELPPLASQNRYMPRTYVGFGFDSKTNDYKVLCIVRGERDNSPDEGVSKIFYLRNGVWRRTRPLMRSWNVEGGSPECYLNEAVHWSGHEIYKRYDHSNQILLSFNMSDECFREMKLPNYAEFDEDDVVTPTRCVTLDRLLSVVVWKRRAGNKAFGIYESCSVWTMKEYGITDSWTKMSNIDLESAQIFPISRFWSSKYHFCENGEVLMVQDLEDGEDVNQQYSVVLYNIRNRERKHLYSVTKYIFDMCLYHESLVLA